MTKDDDVSVSASEKPKGEMHSLQWDAGVTLLVRDLNGAVVALLATTKTTTYVRERWALAMSDGTNANGSKYRKHVSPAINAPEVYKYENLGLKTTTESAFATCVAMWLDPQSVRHVTAFSYEGVLAVPQLPFENIREIE